MRCAAADEMRQDSNIGKGQMQAADFVMTPNVQVGANTSGGIGGFLGGKLGVLGAIAGGLKFKDASTSLLLADVRSSIQVAAAEATMTKSVIAVRLTTESIVIRSASAGSVAVGYCHVDGSAGGGGTWP